MKTKHLLMVLIGAFIFTLISSCEKSPLVEQFKAEEATSKNIYRMSIVDKTVTVEAIDIATISNYMQNSNLNKNGNNHKAVGLVSMGDDMATFNAIQNNGGVHGNTHLSGDSLIFDLKFDSECLLVLGNKAFWGGTITVWEVSDSLAYLPFEPGWRFFWSAIDNGQGANSNPDEIGDALIVVPPGFVSTDLGFTTWCDYAYFDYNLLDTISPMPHFPHGYDPGDDPTNIKIN